MSKHLIFWPLLVQVALPLIVLMLNGKRKAADRSAGLYDSKKTAINNTAWSTPVVLTSNNLANQAQLPVLFYVLCLVLFSLNAINAVMLTLSWLFVGSRYLHAYAHVSNNNVPVRATAFIFGTFVLLSMFILTMFALIAV